MKTNSFFTGIFSTVKSYFTTFMMTLVITFSLASCTGKDDEPTFDNGKVTTATATFTYTVPEELFKYAEITVCYNNNEGTDALWQPMLDNQFTVTYDLNKFPMTAPVVMVYDTTNRSGRGVMVDWNLKMDVEVTMNIDGRTVTHTTSDTYTMNGDLADALTALQKNVQSRTFAVRINKTGTIDILKSGVKETIY